MANKKQAWWEAIDADLPESISGLLDKTIDVSSVTAPADVDAAIIEQGKLAAKLNKLLDDLNGLSLVELALRIGQKNVTSKLMLLAGVEAIEETDDEGFVVLEPQEGKEYQPGEIIIKVKVNDDDIQEISVSVDDGDSQTLTRANGFSGSLLPIPGDRTATFTSDTELTKTVNFYSIEFLLVPFPENGAAVPGPVFEVGAGTMSTGELKEAVATLCFSGQPFTQLELIRVGQEFIWSNLVDLVPAVKDIPVGLLAGAPPGVMDFPLELWVEGVMQVEDTIIPLEKATTQFAVNLGTTIGEFLREHVPGFGEEVSDGDTEGA